MGLAGEVAVQLAPASFLLTYRGEQRRQRRGQPPGHAVKQQKKTAEEELLSR